MLSLVLATVVLQAPKAGQAMLDAWQTKLAAVQSLSMRLAMDFSGQKQAIEVKILRGGYLHAVMPGMNMEEFITPQGGWSLMTNQKQYRKEEPREMRGSDALPGWEALFPNAKPPTAASDPSAMKFGEKDAQRIEIKSESAMQGSGKSYLYFDPVLKQPVGFEATTQGMAMKMAFEDVKLDPGLTPKDFTWTPPQGWTEMNQPEAPDYTSNLLKMGSKAPAFALKTPAGTKMSLAKAMAGKKATLVNFWFYG